MEQSSVSFDPVARQYDATRGYPAEVARQIIQAMDQAAYGNTQTRFLEIGVGTGRFALPLAELGRQYTGIDISEKMLARFLEKLHASSWQETPLQWGLLPDEDIARALEVWRFEYGERQGKMRLIISDATDLPFYDHRFDAVVESHVFHLISDWQKALQEVLRVLRPGGVLLRCENKNWTQQWQTGVGDIRQAWNEIVRESGGEIYRPGVSEEMVTAWLREQGLETEQWEVVRWQRFVTPRSIFEGVAQRLWSNTWSVPDDLFQPSIERLRLWLDDHYGAHIDEEFAQEERLFINRTRV